VLILIAARRQAANNGRIRPDNPFVQPFARWRESSGLYTPQSGQNLDIDPLTRDFFE